MNAMRHDLLDSSTEINTCCYGVWTGTSPHSGECRGFVSHNPRHSVVFVDTVAKPTLLLSVSSQASFVAAAELCTTAIGSFKKLVEHVFKFGDERGNRGTAADGIER